MQPPRKAKAHVAAAVAGMPAVAERRTAVPRNEVPGPAAENPGRTLFVNRVSNSSGWIRSIHILTPLPYIAVHVIQSPYCLTYPQGKILTLLWPGVSRLRHKKEEKLARSGLCFRQLIPTM